MKKYRHAFVLVLSISFLGTAPRAQAADEFYTTRLRAGQDALRAKRHAEAVDLLRIAAFGLLEQPPLLMEALSCLTVAQSRAGRIEAVDVTLLRMVEVERQIPSYARATLDPAVRTEFEALAKKRLPPETSASVPALVGASTKPPAAPSAVPTAVAVAAPVATPVPAPPSVSTPAATFSAPGAAELLASSRKLISEGKNVDARKQLVAALPVHGRNRDVRKALLEASCLSREWKLAVEQIPLVEPFGEGEEPLAFYASVAKFETGDVEAARVLLGRVRSRLASSSYVDYYVKRILG